MEKALYAVLGLKSKVKMSKFGPIYRAKSGNCNKPFRYVRDQRFRQEDVRYSGTNASTSRDISPQQRDLPKDNMVGMPYDRQNRNSGSMFRPGCRYDDRNRRVHVHHDRKMSNRALDLPKEDFHDDGPAGGSHCKPRLKCPPHLKGKEIGLWYKDHRLPREEITEISVDPETEDFITQYLCKTNSCLSENEDDLSNYLRTQDSGTFEEKINLKVFHPKEHNFDLDMKLYNEHMKKIAMPHYAEMHKYRERLPAFKKEQDIIKLINSNQIAVISGGTGCGKTTQIVQFVLDDFIMQKKGSLCNIVCTQPRRISAVSVAERVAAERCEPTGLSIGYQIRLENKLAGRKVGCINFVTTGILLQWLVGEPILQNVTHLFLDEVHERTIECDLVMALLKYIIPKRPDLKVVLMSATVNATSFSDYFDGAPCLEIPGFTYPVEEIFLENILKMTNYKFREVRKPVLEPAFKDYVLPYVRDIEAQGLYPKHVTRELANPLSEDLDICLVAAVVRYICENEDDGAILIFLPGLTDIMNLNKELMKSPWFSPSKYIVVLVHSMLPSIEQKEAFMTPPKGKRKIVISTSILETSVTVDDISFVIDCGKKKLSGYDLKLKVATLQPAWISLANAKQRRGRAGRTKSGKCYKLYTKVRQDIFDQYPTPEIKTTSLEQVILEAKGLKLQRVVPFLEKMMDPPDAEMVELALKVLRNLNALDSEERLTPLGYHLSKLPMDPRTGKMILMAALFSCIDPVFSVAACLSFKDPFSIPFGQEEEVINIKEHFSRGEKSDHFIYSEILRRWEAEEPYRRQDFSYRHFLSNHTMSLLSEMKKQFAEILHSMNFLPSSNVRDPESNVNSENKELLKAIICAGLYPNVAVLKKVKKGAILKTLDHRTVRFHIKSYCYHLDSFESPFFVYHYKLKSTSIFLHDASMITPLPLLLFGESLKITEKEHGYYVEIDELLKFKINKRIALLIKKLRTRLDWTLGLAILNSEGFDWQTPGGKTEILDGIVKLISLNSIKHRTYYKT